MSPSIRASFHRAMFLLAAGLFVPVQSFALDPGTVFLKVTQAQPLVDGRYQVTLQWNALNGATYQVQGQEGLSGTGWLDFGLVTPTTSTGAWTGTIAAGLVDQGRFFMRLVLPQEEIETLEPWVVFTGGGVFYILGQCFSPTDRVFINGVEAVVVVFEDHTRLKVTVGAMAAGVYDVEVRGSDGTTVLAKLTDGLSVTATGRSDEVPPVLPRSVVMRTPAGKVTVILPDDVRAGDTISGTVVAEPKGGGAVRPPTGENTQKKSDLVVPGRGLRFFWGRTYRSKNGPSTAQGEGWDYSYNIRAVQSGGDVVVHDGEGRADTFFNQGDGTWSRPEFFRQGTMSGTVFTLTFADKTTWRFRAFDAPLAAGKIDRMTDRNGNQINFAYDGAGRLVTIIDTLGKNFTVAYNGAGRIASVTDFSGRAVTYGYNAAGDLITVTSPPVTGTPTGNDFPSGKTVTYGYSSGFADARLNHNLLTVTDALGQLVQTFTYAATLVPTDLDFDRCNTETWDPGPPYPTEQVSFYYLPQTPAVGNRFATTLTIINAHGNVSEVRNDSRNRPLEVREYTGRSTPGAFVTDVLNRPTGQLRAGDPPFFSTSFEWNPHSCLTSLTLPRGGIIENIYESDLTTSVNPRERGNLRVQVTTAAPAVPSDFTTITQTWEYLPGFGTCEVNLHRGTCFMVDGSPVVEDVLFRRTVSDPDNLPGGWSATSQFRFIPGEDADDSGECDPGDCIGMNGIRIGGSPLFVADNLLYENKEKDAVAFIAVKRLEDYPDEFGVPGAGGAGIVLLPFAPELFDPTDGRYCFPITHTDRRGITTDYGYDANGNPLTVSPPVAGTGHTFEYNPFGQPTVHIGPQNANGSTRRDEIIYYSAGPQTGWPQSCVVDATGTALTTTFEYNAVGVTTRVIDPRGKDRLITPNALDQPVRIASREASAGVRHETDIRYDANNNVTSIDVQNKDENGALVVANPYFTTSFQYDALNRPESITCEVDGATTITSERVIDANNHTIIWRSPEAVAGAQPLNTTRCVLDERGLPFQVTLAPGAAGQSTTQVDYDLDGNTAVINRGIEGVPQVWLLTWDGNPGLNMANNAPIITPLIGSFDGDLGTTQAKIGCAAGVPLTFTCSSDSIVGTYQIIRGAGSPRVVQGCIDRCSDADQDNYGTAPAGLHSAEDPMGNRILFTYDPNGNTTAARVDGEHNDVPGDAGNVRMAEARQIFDALNRPTTRTGLLLDNAGAQTGSVSATITWAPNSQPASATDPRGNVMTFSYDTANRLALVTDAKTNTRAFAYDANGNALSVTATDKSDLGNPNQVFVVTRTFDGLDRPLSSADNVGNTVQYRYDSRSNLVLRTDARNIQTRFVYDGLCRPLSTARDMDNDGASATDPRDIVTSQTWDRNSRLATATNANGFVTTRNYDALNRPTGTLEADGTTSGSVIYDVHHNVTQSTDANGTVIVNSFDGLNRLIGRNIAPGPGVANTTTSESCTHDGLSRLKSADTNGSAPTSVSRTFDSLSRLLTETQGALTFACARDAAGNVSDFTYPGGNITTTTYDALNRPLAVTDSVSGAIITNAYIGPDRIERQTHGNGTITTFQYNGVQGIANPPGDLGWRQVRAKFVTGPGGSPTHDARQFFFDANQNRNKRINVPTNLVHTHTFDNADRLVNTIVQQGGPPTRNSTYALDKEGNRLNVAGTGDPHPGAYQLNPTLPNPGDAQMNQYTVAPTGVFTYDENGSRQNATSGGTTLQHVYDFAGRLVAINNLTTAQQVAIYAYDSFGRRVQKIAFPGGVQATTNFVFAGGSIIEERGSGGSVTATSYCDGIELWGFPPVAVKRAGAMHTLHTDDKYTVMLITNAAGVPAERYDYQDFGEPQFFDAFYAPQTGSALGNPLLFCGFRFDAETQYFYSPPGCMGGWWLDPWFAPGPDPADRGMHIGIKRGGPGQIDDISITVNADKTSTGLMRWVSSGNPVKPANSGGRYLDPKTGSGISSDELPRGMKLDDLIITR